jgi:hypothetical protein
MGIDQFAVQINLTLATGFLWFLFKKKHPVSFCKSLVLFLLLLLITQLVYTLAKTILPNPFAPGVHYVMVQNDGHELVVISPTEFFIIYLSKIITWIFGAILSTVILMGILHAFHIWWCKKKDAAYQ